MLTRLIGSGSGHGAGGGAGAVAAGAAGKTAGATIAAKTLVGAAILATAVGVTSVTGILTPTHHRPATVREPRGRSAPVAAPSQVTPTVGPAAATRSRYGSPTSGVRPPNGCIQTTRAHAQQVTTRHAGNVDGPSDSASRPRHTSNPSVASPRHADPKPRRRARSWCERQRARGRSADAAASPSPTEHRQPSPGIARPVWHRSHPAHLSSRRVARQGQIDRRHSGSSLPIRSERTVATRAVADSLTVVPDSGGAGA
jgi:hypothetical protein